MINRPYDLPAMTTLRTFEAAARRGAFNEAASEMNVTPGAVSHQVKALEKELGVALFVRGHRSVDLTEEGEQLYRVLRQGFQDMGRVVQQLRRRGEEQRVVIAATTAVSSLWLTPRIVTFWREHGDIAINQQLTDRRIKRPLTTDLAIEYCVEPPAEPTSVRLFGDTLVPVCSTAMARKIESCSLADLAEAPLIHMDAPERNWTTWQKWFERMGYSGEIPRGQQVNNYSIALQIAREGAGVVLGWKTLIAPLFEQGAIVCPTGFQCAAPGAFYLVASEQTSNPASRVFFDWMKRL